jgi:hypothetical protein
MSCLFLFLSILIILSEVQSFSRLYGERCYHVKVSRRNCYMASVDNLGDRILKGLQIKYPEPSGGGRVIRCFERFLKGEDLSVQLPGSEDPHNRQYASCWVEGLTAMSFYDLSSDTLVAEKKLQWARDLQAQSNIVINEFQSFLQTKNKEEEWLGSRNSGAGQAYGPGWKTFGIQDRGIWDVENVKLFPNTVKLIQNLNIPCLEVLFAKQEANSGIKPHSDMNNFVLTCHLGVQVEREKAWLRVGEQREYWQEGHALLFDTSILHSTANEANTDRYVLMMRVWHPELTDIEIQALT